jgi:hypothetical protein
MPKQSKGERVIARHNRQNGVRTLPLYFYATPVERADIDAMRRRYGPIPLSRSLLIRTALAALKRIMDTGYNPPLTEHTMMVEREDNAELPTKLALAIDFAALVGLPRDHQTGHADARA